IDVTGGQWKEFFLGLQRVIDLPPAEVYRYGGSNCGLDRSLELQVYRGTDLKAITRGVDRFGELAEKTTGPNKSVASAYAIRLKELYRDWLFAHRAVVGQIDGDRYLVPIADQVFNTHRDALWAFRNYVDGARVAIRRSEIGAIAKGVELGEDLHIQRMVQGLKQFMNNPHGIGASVGDRVASAISVGAFGFAIGVIVTIAAVAEGRNQP
ncbi:MAG: hypothetical protein HYW02_03640, partial [Deltaproteobacteria bacterium]|nr:hypothetical protein [Deltaproteobacteria bacterium]